MLIFGDEACTLNLFQASRYCRLLTVQYGALAFTGATYQEHLPLAASAVRLVDSRISISALQAYSERLRPCSSN